MTARAVNSGSSVDAGTKGRWESGPVASEGLPPLGVSNAPSAPARSRAGRLKVFNPLEECQRGGRGRILCGHRGGLV